MNLCKLFLCGCVCFVSLGVFSGCNPSKRINYMVSQRDKEGREVKIVQPQRAVATPKNINMVYDFEQLFNRVQQSYMDSLVRVFEKSNLIAVKVITVTPNQLGSVDFDTYSRQQLREWSGVHGNSDKAIVVTMSRAMGKASINCGSFVTQFLSNEEANAIVTTWFQMDAPSNQVYNNTWNGLNALINTIRANIRL